MRHILITGATGGIGSSIARALTSPDCSLHLAGREPSRLQSLAVSLEHSGAVIFTYHADLSKDAEREAFSRKLASHADTVDWIIHAIGHIDPQEPFESLDSASVSTVFEINALASISLTQLMTPRLKKGGGVIYIGSTAGLWGNGRFPVYSASKAALIMFARAVAKQWQQSGISSIAVCPGPTDTSMMQLTGSSEKGQPAEAVAELIRRIVNGESYKNGDTVIIRDGKETLHQEI